MKALPPFLSGEMHYPRVPREYWRHRMRMARAMGLNALSTYVFWNVHEPVPGAFDFSGRSDVAAYLRAAREEGLRVILRPGPYVCAEWDFGGLPAWLLADGAMRVRTSDERYIAHVRRWLKRLGEEIASSLCDGTIVAVQFENEYGAHATDPRYLGVMREAYREAGLAELPMFTIDQPADLRAGAMDDLPAAVTFAARDARAGFEALRQVRPAEPPVCGEFWAGWFDHWGEARPSLDDDEQVRAFDWMMQQGASINFYMFHGGTNPGFWNGANSTGESPYSPDTTSYDYQAALDEAGRPRAKFHGFRRVIAARTGVQPPQVPEVPRIEPLAPFRLTEFAPLSQLFGDPVLSEEPLSMEAIGQFYGYALYRTQLSERHNGILSVEGVRDYAVVLLDGVVAGHLDRRLGLTTIALPSFSGTAILDVLVENGGRINYGLDFADERKGIIGPAGANGEPLRGWQTYRLPMNDLTALRFSTHSHGPLGFYRGTFDVERPADTFLDVSALGKGTLWINGHHAGRFWRVGPQMSLYVPGVWLTPGRNEVVAFDLEAPSDSPALRGLAEPLAG